MIIFLLYELVLRFIEVDKLSQRSQPHFNTQEFISDAYVEAHQIWFIGAQGTRKSKEMNKYKNALWSSC